MIYKVSGTIKGKTCSLTWQDGKLTGDHLAVELVKYKARLLRQVKESVGPVGMYLEADIGDPLAALFVIREVFDKGLTATGEVPQPPEVPKGAII